MLAEACLKPPESESKIFEICQINVDSNLYFWTFQTIILAEYSYSYGGETERTQNHLPNPYLFNYLMIKAQR